MQRPGPATIIINTIASITTIMLLIVIIVTFITVIGITRTAISVTLPTDTMGVAFSQAPAFNLQKAAILVVGRLRGADGICVHRLAVIPDLPTTLPAHGCIMDLMREALTLAQSLSGDITLERSWVSKMVSGSYKAAMMDMQCARGHGRWLER